MVVEKGAPPKASHWSRSLMSHSLHVHHGLTHMGIRLALGRSVVGKTQSLIPEIQGARTDGAVGSPAWESAWFMVAHALHLPPLI